MRPPIRNSILGAWLAVLIGLNGCVLAPSSRIGDYLSGLSVPPVQTQPLATPIHAGLVLAMPQEELDKPTAPSKTLQEKLMERIRKEFQDPQRVEVEQVLPPITLPGNGLSALTRERLQEMTQGKPFAQIFVVVATSQTAQRVLPYPLYEVQLFVRMDLALVDLTAGQVLLTEVGQEDYDMEDRYDGVKDILYPRVFYRTITRWAGPFKLVEGNPYIALGEETFSGAADQLIMRLRERVNPS